jgi:hypothetical protein
VFCCSIVALLPAVIDLGLQGHREDVDRIIEAIRRLQRIMAAPAMKEAYAPTLLHAKSLAAEFGADTDRYWREYIVRAGFVVRHVFAMIRLDQYQGSV